MKNVLLRSKVGIRVGAVAAVVAAIALPITLPVGTAVSGAASSGSGCTLHLLGETRTSTAESKAWSSIFSDFKTQYHCTVTATWEGQFTGVPQLLNEANIAHQTVDLVTDTTENFNLASAGDLEDITKLIKPYESRFDPGTLEPFTVDSHVWGVPIEPETSSVFFYNASLFSKLGLTAPTTFTQLVHDSDVIKSKTKVEPFVEGGSDTWEWPMWYMATFAQTSGNKSVQDTESFLDGKYKFTSKASVQALKDLAEFSKDGIINENALGTDENGAVAAFLQGKAAMMFDGTWDLPTFRAGNPKFRIGVFMFPQVTSTPGVVAQSNGSATEGLSIPSSIPKKDLPMADQFLEFITSPKEANKLFATLDPVVPTIKGTTPGNDPLSKTLSSYLPRTNGWLDWLWPTDVVTSIETAISGVMFTGVSPKSAAQSVQNELDTLRGQQNYTFNFWSKWSAAQKAAVEPAKIPKIQVQN
ncbi:MAG TPA: extracellular solute-binding protein [Acidimicrobiales bacterium]